MQNSVAIAAVALVVIYAVCYTYYVDAQRQFTKECEKDQNWLGHALRTLPIQMYPEACLYTIGRCTGSFFQRGCEWDRLHDPREGWPVLECLLAHPHVNTSHCARQLETALRHRSEDASVAARSNLTRCIAKMMCALWMYGGVK